MASAVSASSSTSSMQKRYSYQGHQERPPTLTPALSTVPILKRTSNNPFVTAASALAVIETGQHQTGFHSAYGGSCLNSEEERMMVTAQEEPNYDDGVSFTQANKNQTIGGEASSYKNRRRRRSASDDDNDDERLEEYLADIDSNPAILQRCVHQQELYIELVLCPSNV